MDHLDKIGEYRNELEQRLHTLIREIGERTVLRRLPVTGLLKKDCGYKSGSVLPKIDGTFKPFGERETFGGKRDTHAWFYGEFEVPKSENGRFELYVATQLSGWDANNPQFILYLDGEIVEGMDTNHRTAIVPEGKHSFYLYAYTGTDNDNLLFLSASLTEIDELCEKVYYDLFVPAETLRFTEPASPEYAEMLRVLTPAMNLLDLRGRNTPEYREGLLQTSLYMDKEFYGKLCKKSDRRVSCIGHTHIDIAWLWSVRQTYEKAQRSFATVIELMKKYPDYRFTSSQAVLYKAVKEECPTLYEKIKERIAEGRWEVEGGMWVEADCNLPSGESLVRQFLYGKRFFRREFGVESKTLWLPDVFGYSAALPQILLGSGVDNFVTSKISWNDVNGMPYDTFSWRGIDGSEVFSSFITTQDFTKDFRRQTSYVAELTPSNVAGAFRRYQQKYYKEDALMTVGHGDGGGGTTPRDCQMMMRLDKGIPGLPTPRFTTVAAYMKNAKSGAKKDLPLWVGELYLEYHRGTYTSEANNKYNNRKCEFLLGDAEQIGVLAKLLTGRAPETGKLYALWETMMTNQFHDIIPGSSIKEVYEQTDKEYAEAFAFGNREIGEALDAIAKHAAGEGILVWNPNGAPYSGEIAIDGKFYTVSGVPAYGYAVLPETPAKTSVKIGDRRLENARLRVKFDKNYDIVSVYDKKKKRELLKEKRKIEYLAYEDYNPNYDAWELSHFYREKVYPVCDLCAAEPFTEGDKAGFRIEKHFSGSKIVERAFLREGGAMLEFETELDWQTEHIMLKKSFPLDVLTDKATCEIQYGAVERPTHANTSWDAAKFEVCAHKFVDLSETDYGVALLNDSKYGHGLQNNDVTLSLLKCATHPNPDCDKGYHVMRYALYPHENAALAADVTARAYAFNNPVYATRVTGNPAKDVSLPEKFSLVTCSCDHIVISAVKIAEDGDGVIVRLYETSKRRADVTLNFGFDFAKVVKTNLIEDEIEEIPHKGRSLKLSFKPFEIKAFKLKF